MIPIHNTAARCLGSAPFRFSGDLYCPVGLDIVPCSRALHEAPLREGPKHAVGAVHGRPVGDKGRIYGKSSSKTGRVRIRRRSLLSRVLPAIDLARVAEERISSFEPRELEKIILQLARDELKAIVWMGAGLGLVMGMLSALINLIG